ncbi:hypothetical protein COBT_001773, partial [Conglomerata obtusa]
MFLFKSQERALIDACYTSSDPAKISLLIHFMLIKHSRLIKVMSILQTKMKKRKNIYVTSVLCLKILENFACESVMYEDMMIKCVRSAVKRSEEKVVVDLLKEIQKIGVKSYKGEKQLKRVIKAVSNAMEQANREERRCLTYEEIQAQRKKEMSLKSTVNYKNENSVNHDVKKNETNTKNIENDNFLAKSINNENTTFNYIHEKLLEKKDEGFDKNIEYNEIKNCKNDDSDSFDSLSSSDELLYTSARDNFLLDVLEVLVEMKILNYDYREKVEYVINTLTLSLNIEKRRKILGLVCKSLNVINVKLFCYVYFEYCTVRYFQAIDVVMNSLREDLLIFFTIEGNKYLGQHREELTMITIHEINERNEECKRKLENRMNKLELKKYFNSGIICEKIRLNKNDNSKENINDYDKKEKNNENKKEVINENKREKNNENKKETIKQNTNENINDNIKENTFENKKEKNNENKKINENKKENTWENINKKEKEIFTEGKRDFIMDAKNQYRKDVNYDGKKQITNLIDDDAIKSDNNENLGTISENHSTVIEDDVISNAKDSNKILSDVIGKTTNQYIKQNSDDDRFYANNEAFDPEELKYFGMEIFPESLHIFSNKPTLMVLQWLYTLANIPRMSLRSSTEIAQSYFYLIKQIFNYNELPKKYSKDENILTTELIAYCNFAYLNNRYFALDQEIRNNNNYYNNRNRRNDALNEINSFTNTNDEYYYTNNHNDKINSSVYFNDTFLDDGDLFLLRYLTLYIKKSPTAQDTMFYFLKKTFQNILVDQESNYTLNFQKLILFLTGKYLIEDYFRFDCKFYVLIFKLLDKLEIHKEILYWLIEKACDHNTLNRKQSLCIISKIRVLFYNTHSKTLYRVLLKWICVDMKDTIRLIHTVNKQHCWVICKELNLLENYYECKNKIYSTGDDENRYKYISTQELYNHSMKSSINLQTFSEKRKTRI